MAWNMVTQYCNTNDFGSVAWFKFPMSKTFSKDTARYHREAAVFRQCYVHNGFSHLWTRSKGARIKWIIEPLRRCIDFLSTCDIMWHHLTSNPIEFTETIRVKLASSGWRPTTTEALRSLGSSTAASPFHCLSLTHKDWCLLYIQTIFSTIQWSKDAFWHFCGNIP